LDGLTLRLEPVHMPATITDPAVKQFVTKVTASAGAVPDAIAGLLLRLCARVSSLEQTAKAQAVELDRLRKTSSLLPPALLAAPPMEPDAEPAFDAEAGALERSAVKRPVGRPRGRKDSHPRRAPLRAPEDDGSRWLVDRGSDEGVG
jgi:hypothetical protein